MEKSNTYTTLNWWHKFRLKIIAKSIIVGLVTGILVVVYRLMLEEAESIRVRLFAYVSGHNLLSIILWFGSLVLIGWVIGWIIKKQPMLTGSGIPQVKGLLLRQIHTNWIKIIIGKLFGGILAVGAGLSLGREGPSVQIGASLGQGLNKMMGNLKVEEKYLISAGAGAGLAAAFNAPLAGVVFVLEEIHRNFSPLILASAMAASITADFISKEFFGLKPVLEFSSLAMVPLSQYFYLIVLGCIIGLFGSLFNSSLVKTQAAIAGQKWLPSVLRPVLPLMSAGILAFILPEVLGGGHDLIISLSEGVFPLAMLLILLAAKFLFTMVSYGSGSPGGIFLPLLAIGALTGAIYGGILVRFFNFDPQYVNNFIVLAMAGYFTAIVKAPITGIILITEMIGSFSHLLALTVVAMTAYVITELVKAKPVYELLLQNMLKDKGGNNFIGEEKNKVLLEIPVCMGSMLEGKLIKDIDWPYYCLLVSIKRGENEIIPNGNIRLYSSDYIMVLTNENYACYVQELLLAMAEEGTGAESAILSQMAPMHI